MGIDTVPRDREVIELVVVDLDPLSIEASLCQALEPPRTRMRATEKHGTQLLDIKHG